MATAYDAARPVNLRMWDERVPAHVASRDYAVARFREDPQFLSGVVRFDLPRLGDVRGLRGAHLQCHIGTDTVSLARLGATMTGLDFSAPAVEAAAALARDTGADATFVVGDVHDAVDLLGGASFDLVYTGVGALCWLPSADRWARVVAGLLRPGGRLFLREGHPMLWALAELGEDRRLVVGHPYFETEAPMIFHDNGTYVETDATFSVAESHEWNHGVGEIVTALLDHGLTLSSLTEHRSVPWDALPGSMTIGEDGEFRLRENADHLPLSYTLTAVLPG